MNGRSFACFSRTSVAWTRAWASASSGRFRSPVEIRSSIGQPSATRRRTVSGGSTGATTSLGSSRMRRTSSAEATSSSPTASSTFFRWRSRSARLRRWSASRPAPLRAYDAVRSARVSAFAAASRAMASRPAACCRSRYASATPSRASFVATWIAGPAGVDDLPGGERLEDGVGEPEDRGQPRDLGGAAGRDRAGDARTGGGRRRRGTASSC